MMFLTEMRPTGARPWALHPHATTPTLETPTGFQPRVSLTEAPTAFLLHVEIPGIDPTTIDLSLTDGELTIKGIRPEITSEADQIWLLRETIWGEFERTFTFPKAVLGDGIEAETRFGILTIKIAKAPEAITRKIPITIGSA